MVRENEPLRSWEKKTLESCNSKKFNGDHQNLVLLENCVGGEATDVGVTHSSSLVARQKAVLGHLPFATWVTSRLQLHFTAAITCISLGFLQYLLGISFHISAPIISSEKKTVQAGEVGGPLQFLGEGADRAP